MIGRLSLFNLAATYYRYAPGTGLEVLASRLEAVAGSRTWTNTHSAALPRRRTPRPSTSGRTAMARCSDSSVMCPSPRNLTVPDVSAGQRNVKLTLSNGSPKDLAGRGPGGGVIVV